MARTLTADTQMRLMNHRNVPTMPTSLDNEYWNMIVPAMPPTPPSSSDQLPHRADGSRHLSHHEAMLQAHNASMSLSKQSGHGDSMMDVMSDDAQLFEHALMAMRRDQHTYHTDEAKSLNLAVRSKPRNDSVVQKVQPVKKKQSRANAARVAKNGAVRPPALCATHPSLYKAPVTPKPQRQPQTMLLTPPPETRDEIKSVKPTAKFVPPPRPSHQVPWKVYNDPNKLISAEPQFDDPKYRMLRMDVNPDQPNVVSPLFMIGMPCGSLLEAANYYGDDDTQG